MRILLGLVPASAHAADVVATGAMPDALLPPPTPLTASQSLYLEVSLNQAARGLLPFTDDHGRLQASPQVLRQLGFPARGDAPVYLDQLMGVQVRYDARMQTLALDAPLDALQLPTTAVGARPADIPVASSSPGVLLNYDLYGTHVADLSSLALTSEVRLFGIGRGTLSNLALQRRFQDGDARRWRSDSVRLDTRWTLDFPQQAVTLEVGDFYSGFLDWSRPVRMGGLQIGRNYGLQPYRVLSPTPSFLGQAVVPSNVELYVDGLRQYSGAVPVGPFQLATQPGISGTGTAQVVITDAFGRTRTVDFDFYGTQQLLARGLTDWSVGVGRLREDYGVRSFAYDNRTLASATWRHGVSDRFTAEAHAEAGGGLRTAGVGGGWLAGRAGVVTLAYARSALGALEGGQYSMGYNWNNRRYNLNLLSRRTHGDYRDLGALQDSLPADITEQATFGVSLDRLGAFSASYLRLRQAEGQDDRYASVFWSRTFAQRWSAYVSVNQNLSDGGDRSIYASLATTLGRDRQASAAVQHNGGEALYSVDVSQPVPGDGGGNGMGWRVQARQGDRGTGGLAEAGWLTPTGRYALGAVHEGDSTYGYANAGGALVWMGGHLFAAREVNDAFAVVSTGGIEGVPVRLENRPVGITNRRGLLLVSPLLSWQRNRLSIDTLGLPADIAAERVDDWVTPSQGAGLGVSFGLRRSRAVQLVVHDVAGQPLPAGSVARFGEQGDAVVGYDGALYIQDLPSNGRLDIATSEGRCVLAVPPLPVAADGAIPRLGPLVCQPVADEDVQ